MTYTGFENLTFDELRGVVEQSDNLLAIELLRRASEEIESAKAAAKEAQDEVRSIEDDNYYLEQELDDLIVKMQGLYEAVSGS